MQTQMKSEAVAETLQRIESTERRSRAALLAATVLEGMFLASFLWLADLKDRTHLLLLLSAASMLTLGALWGVALVGIVNRHTLRVMRAVELLRPESDRATR
ncbi:MAG: hypothetical protein H0W08_20780 [Acidobacteria bacterium]|nr:hypothetical protein [Acidobacteriota bacterium]